jgi:hypothetical protein
MAVPIVDPQDTGTANLSAPVSRPPDIQDASNALYAPTQAGLTADGLRLQGIAQVYQQQTQAAPDVVERYAATHSLGASQSVTSVSRPPDVADTALAVRYGSTSSFQSDGFDWSDWAIGIGSGMGIALLLGGALLMSRQLRHPVQTA